MRRVGRVANVGRMTTVPLRFEILLVAEFTDEHHHGPTTSANALRSAVVEATGGDEMVRLSALHGRGHGGGHDPETARWKRC